MTLTFSKKIKTALSISLLLTSSFAASSSFASRRGMYFDTINLLPAGKITDHHSQGDIHFYTGETDSSFIIAFRFASEGCPSGRTYKNYHYFSAGPTIIHECCAGDGTVSITYTTNDGKVCHITVIDSASRKNASIQSADCDYSYNQKQYYNTGWSNGTINQFDFNTGENPTDISGI